MTSRCRIGIATVGLLAAMAAHAGAPLPEGSYRGDGQWSGEDGASGSYAVETTVQDGTVTSRYTYSQAGSRSNTVTLKLVPTAGPFVDVQDGDGAVLGNGYCYQGACVYRAEFGPAVVQETIRFDDGLLEKLGSKTGPGFRVVWKETLSSD